MTLSSWKERKRDWSRFILFSFYLCFSLSGGERGERERGERKGKYKRKRSERGVKEKEGRGSRGREMGKRG